MGWRSYLEQADEVGRKAYEDARSVKMTHDEVRALLVKARDNGHPSWSNVENLLSGDDQRSLEIFWGSHCWYIGREARASYIAEAPAGVREAIALHDRAQLDTDASTLALIDGMLAIMDKLEM